MPYTLFLSCYHTFALPFFFFAEQPLILLVAVRMIGADLRTKRFLPRASNGNVLPRCRLKQIVYLSTWKYCCAFPGQIASFRLLVKIVSISFDRTFRRDTQSFVIGKAYSQFHSTWRLCSKTRANNISRTNCTIDFSTLEKPLIFK